jgi:hypothetical protein
MPESFVKRIAICFVTTVIVIPFFLAREFVPLFQFQNKHTAFVFDFSLALIWVVGVLLLTTPLNCPEAKRYGLAVNGILRRIARWCSVGVIGIVISEYVVFTPLYVLAGIVFIVGVVCLLLLLANIADWVRDESAKKWLEYAAWGAPFFFVVSQVLHLQQISPVINYGAKLLMYIFIVGGIFGLFMLTSSVVQAITHARNYREYQKRRLKSKDSTQFPYPK